MHLLSVNRRDTQIIVHSLIRLVLYVDDAISPTDWEHDLEELGMMNRPGVQNFLAGLRNQEESDDDTATGKYDYPGDSLTVFDFEAKMRVIENKLRCWEGLTSKPTRAMRKEVGILLRETHVSETTDPQKWDRWSRAQKTAMFQ